MKTPEIYVLVHNIRSLYNVGSIFRTSDAANVTKIFLTGYSGPPDSKEVEKTALGATKSVPWEYQNDPIKLILSLKRNGVSIVALEQNEKSIDYSNFKPQFPLCLIIGHEVLGVDESLLQVSDSIIELPMFGEKQSLNVSVAFGICIYKLLEG